MKAPRLVFSDAAIADILEQSDWYAQKVGRSVANVGKEVSLQRCSKSPDDQAPAHPATSARKSFAVTRRTFVAGFPKHLIFYQAHESEILILRVVHGARDLESLFSEGGSSES